MALYLGISAIMGIPVYTILFFQPLQKAEEVVLQPCPNIYPEIIAVESSDKTSDLAEKQMEALRRTLDSIYGESDFFCPLLRDTIQLQRKPTLIPRDPNPFYLNFDERMEDNLEAEIPEIYLFEEPDLKEFSCIFITEEEPVPLNLDEVRKMIGYPEIALKAEIEGIVIVQVFIDKHGVYKKHKILKDPQPILTEAVETHIEKLRFEPAHIGGKALSGIVNIPFIFAIEK